MSWKPGGTAVGTLGSIGGEKKSFNVHGKNFGSNLNIINTVNQSTTNYTSIENQSSSVLLV